MKFFICLAMYLLTPELGSAHIDEPAHDLRFGFPDMTCEFKPVQGSAPKPQLVIKLRPLDADHNFIKNAADWVQDGTVSKALFDEELISEKTLAIHTARGEDTSYSMLIIVPDLDDLPDLKSGETKLGASLVKQVLRGDQRVSLSSFSGNCIVYFEQ